MKLRCHVVVEFLSGNTSEIFDRKAIVLGYSIDSRTVRAGEVFFAVKGEKMDGHDLLRRP